MTKKQFLDAIDKIDDKFINELNIPDNSHYNLFADEKPQKVYLTDDRVPFWKTALSAAAAVCVLILGASAAFNLRTPPDSANDSATSEIIVISGEMSDSESVQTPSEKLGLFERGGGEPFTFRILEGDENPVYTETLTKNDNEQYATLEIMFRGAVSLGVYREEEPNRCLGKTYLDDGGEVRKLFIDYVEEVKDGEKLYLEIHAAENSVIEGKWLP